MGGTCSNVEGQKGEKNSPYNKRKSVMLPREYRITKKGDFDYVFKKGRSSSAPLFTIRYKSSDLLHSRVGIIVSNKISKKAVVRNKIKRRFRAASAQLIVGFPRKLDIIIIAKHAIVNTDYQELFRALSTVFSRIAKDDHAGHYRRVSATPLP